MKITILLGLTFFSINQIQAQVLVSDNFSGSSVNTSLWNVVLPESDASVTEGNGYLSLENAGRITTQVSIPTSYEIYGSFLMANNPYSNFKVMLRTDGNSLPSPNAPVPTLGIEVQFNIEDDPAGGGSTTDNLKIFADGAELANTSANLTLNNWNTFLITDNGFDINLYFDGSSTPSLSAQSSYSGGDLVSFYNREGAGNGSSISANGITELNDILITETPEPSSIALLGFGILSLFALRTRWNMGV